MLAASTFGVAHQGRAAVAVDDALGIACRARRIVERQRLPLVVRHAPAEPGVPRGEERLVVGIGQGLGGLRKLLVVIVDDERPDLGHGQRMAHRRRELAVADHRLGVGVVELEGDRRGVEPGVERMQDGAGHGHAVVGLDHRRGVGEHDGDGVAGPDGAAGQCRGEPPRAVVELGIGEPQPSVDHRRMSREHRRGPVEKAQRRQRPMVGRVPVEVLAVEVFRHGRASGRFVGPRQPSGCATPGAIAPHGGGPRRPTRQRCRCNMQANSSYRSAKSVENISLLP